MRARPPSHLDYRVTDGLLFSISVWLVTGIVTVITFCEFLATWWCPLGSVDRFLILSVCTVVTGFRFALVAKLRLRFWLLLLCALACCCLRWAWLGLLVSLSKLFPPPRPQHQYHITIISCQ